jgi:hypothetical protein
VNQLLRTLTERACYLNGHNADDGAIARHARENAFCLITRDKDFGDIRNYPPGDYGGIIVLNLPDDFRTTDVLRLLEVFLSRKRMVGTLAGTARDCRTLTGALPSELADSPWRDFTFELRSPHH